VLASGDPLWLHDGLPYDVFDHDGELANGEVRAAALIALAPLLSEKLRYVGAGCGSIATELLRAGDLRSAVTLERSATRLR
jgi:precorrin-6B methylase 2